MKNTRRVRASAAILVLILVSAPVTGCATLQQIAALRDVQFSLTGVTDPTLAGVSIGSVRSFSDLNVLDAARVSAAFAGGKLPFSATVMVRADNPAENGSARLVALDWTLFLDDQQTVSGTLNREYVLPPGEPVEVPVQVNLDLLQFFDRQLQSVVNVALAATGQGNPASIYLEATPSIRTALGVLRSPQPIRIQYKVGG